MLTARRCTKNISLGGFHETNMKPPPFGWKNTCLSGSFFQVSSLNTLWKKHQNFYYTPTVQQSKQRSHPNHGLQVTELVRWFFQHFSSRGVRIWCLETYFWKEKLPMHWKNDTGYLRIFFRCVQLTHLPGWWHGNITDDMSQVECSFGWLTWSDFDFLLV